jgi:hypothetical protein
MASKMKNSISTGVKKGHFGVTDMKIDSQVLSLKKWRNLTGVNLMRIGVTKKKLASKTAGLASRKNKLAPNQGYLALLP